jgi:hypothetical protein
MSYVGCQNRTPTSIYIRGCRIVNLLLSPIVILRTPTDIFPNVDIPVIGLVFAYPEETEGRITTVFERPDNE